MPSVRFEPKGTVVDVPAGTLLIDAVQQAGLPIAHSCGDGLICAQCGVRVLEGRVSDEKPVERNSKRRNRIDPELRLACAVRVHEDLRITADYWGLKP